jgi:hypothetical protein
MDFPSKSIIFREPHKLIIVIHISWSSIKKPGESLYLSPFIFNFSQSFFLNILIYILYIFLYNYLYIYT